jgi:hypothetical protein
MDLLTGQSHFVEIFSWMLKKPFQILDSIRMVGFTVILIMGRKYKKGKILRKKDGLIYWN